MSLYIIVAPKVDPNDFSDLTDLFEDAMVDYADLLQLTCSLWPHFGDLREDEEGLKAAIEAHLANTPRMHLRNYAHMQTMIDAISGATRRFHTELKGQLEPLLQAHGMDFDVQINLSRFLHKDAVLRLEFQHHEN